jgi:PAS domain S-box-containing protein
MPTDLQQQLEQLQQAFQSLQDENRALKGRLLAQEAVSERWLQQRDRELKAQTQEYKKAEALQRVFYRIAERATAGLSFYLFLQTVHQLLGELLYAKNCYVCLYDAVRHRLDYPYYEDERDGKAMQVDNVGYRYGLTEYVLRTGEAQLIDAARLAELQASGDVTEATGDLSFYSWLGVPMQIGGDVAGVLVVQSYEGGVGYSLADAGVLQFVANHVSSAIERYRAIEEVRNSEARYRSVIENVGVGVVVVQEGRMVFANPSMERIVGHPKEYLLSRPFTATIHPDDVATVQERHDKRLAGEPVESHYGFRVITQQGEVRWLELSAVMIQWSKRDATLLFVVDVTARMQAEQSQRIALQKQVELTDIKTRFIAMASHEFRTPLATIHGSVELLKHYQDRMPVDKKQQVLQKIDDAVQRMTHMLENVLVIGRTDAGHLQFKPKHLPLRQFCLGLLEELRTAMPAAYDNVRITLDLPPPERSYLLDDTLIRNIVGNLLSNAVKYSPNGGEVCLGAYERDGVLIITVADHGIGIPQADQALLFESFHRASNVGAIAGTGLGLSIVKQAVDCHLGSISVQSTVGRGSAFTIVLPLSFPQPSSERP